MIVYFALTLMVLLGFVGLAIDVGRMELGTIQLQAVADDAALTIATEYQNGNGNFQSIGSTEAASAATAAGLSNVSVSFSWGAGTGPYATDYSAIRATVTQQIPLYLIGLVTGSKTRTLSATAVADFQPCSYFTNANANSSIQLASAGMYAPCAVYAAGAVNVDYFGNLNVLQGKVTGLQSASNMGGRYWNMPIFSAPVLPDPLAYVVAPVFQSCTPGDSNLSISSPTTLYAGTYCGGLTIKNTTVTLQPGLYIITGGFSLATGGTINGTGVTLYFTQGGGSSFGNVLFGTNNVNGDTYVNLSAPTDSSAGGIPAIVLYTDPAWTGSGELDFNTCVWNGSGIFYSKTATVFLWQSSMDQGTYFGMDVSSLYDYATDLHLIPNYASLPGGNPFHIPVTLVQ